MHANQDQERLSDTLREVRQLASSSVVFVSGNFNVVHSGHIRLLNFAKSLGGPLVVGLFDDSCSGVLLPFLDREHGLRGLTSVDFVIPVSAENFVTTLEALKPSLVVKGKEHESNINPEQTVLKAWGGRLVFSGGESTLSSRDLIRQELASPATVSINRDPNFLIKHNSSRQKLINLVQAFKGLQVGVFGDLIVDEYIYCDALGMSQEDPTLVVTPMEKKLFVGGAGIVAAHLSTLGAQTTLFTVTGGDFASIDASVRLKQYGVFHEFVVDLNRPTTLKQRYKVGNKTMLRVSHLQVQDIDSDHQDTLYSNFVSNINECDYVVFSDFNYGVLTKNLVNRISKTCQSEKIRYAADSQSSSQIGDVSRFEYADILAATEREVRLALSDHKVGLQFSGNSLARKSKANNMLLKLGAEGLIIIAGQESLTTDKLSALNRNPVDVAGAGDAMLAAASLCRAAGGSIWEAAYLGSVAAAIQISRIGNIPLRAEELIRELE
jgi:rfaE bifunctional protein kinase chain/domain